MVAFHFPPFGGSSGSRRTVAFARYLPRDGWNPVVLTASVRAYDMVKLEELRDIARDLPVYRAFALDVVRHLSIRGRYPGWLAVPDRWVSWQGFAYRAGLRLIRQHQARVIWTTYPIASAHAIGARLRRKTGLPWIADMRDPMVETDAYTGEEYPRDPRVRAARLDIETRVARDAAHVVFCTEAAREIFVGRFGESTRARTSVIPNGYDEEAFIDAERATTKSVWREQGAFKLIHSGTVYPGDDRGPEALFEAIKFLRDRHELPRGFQLVLRATGNDDQLARLIDNVGVGGLIEVAPALPYREALQEMLSADGLLLLQGRASNPAVPAKLYEYLRARRPILALVHHEGEAAALLSRLHAAVMAPLDDVDAIATSLREVLNASDMHSLPMAAAGAVASFSRSVGAHELSELLSRLSR